MKDKRGHVDSQFASLQTYYDRKWHPLESTVSAATIYSITLQLSITLPEASFTPIYDVSIQASLTMTIIYD